MVLILAAWQDPILSYKILLETEDYLSSGSKAIPVFLQASYWERLIKDATFDSKVATESVHLREMSDAELFTISK